VSIAEAARRIGCSRWRLYRLIEADKFPPAVRMGPRCIMVNIAMLDEYMRTGGVQ
jgi:excisionase family DNA binding protein